MIGWGGSRRHTPAAPAPPRHSPEAHPDADAFGEERRITAAVKIGNVPVARPQTGLEVAHVAHTEEVEVAHVAYMKEVEVGPSRLMAV
ncbi:hypothetical protein [Streptomyces camelliae]|uniref:hypothetical protein n=1 Tax=Streptomyces camelliae TaxID=3004093 RepID=UPI003D162B2E